MNNTPNLLSEIQDIFSGNTLDALSREIGENTQDTTTALNGAIPAIFGNLINSAASGDGFKSIFNTVKKDYNPSILDNVNNLLLGTQDIDKKRTFMDHAQSLLPLIMGNTGRGDNFLSALIRYSGISKMGGVKLIQYVVPTIMALLNKHITSRGLNLKGFADLLFSQSSFVRSAMPSGFANLLGDDANFNYREVEASPTYKQVETPTNVVKKSPKPVVAAVDRNSDEKSGGFLKWLLPLLLVGLVALGLYYMLNNKSTTDEVKTTQSTQVTTDKTNTTHSATNSNNNQISNNERNTTTASSSTTNNTTNNKVIFPAGSVQDRLNTVLANETVSSSGDITLDGFGFMEDGNINVSSNRILNDLILILKQNPNTHVAITAHAPTKAKALNMGEKIRAYLINRKVSSERFSINDVINQTEQVTIKRTK